MADLTEQGFLAQPHTSAGRVPTDKAYRFYVDTLSSTLTLPEETKDMIDRSISESPEGMEKTLAHVTKLLSGLTMFTGVAASPKIYHTRLKMIEFIKINPKQIFVVLITKSNIVHNKMVELGEDLSSEFLLRISKYLNSQFNESSLMDIREKVLESLVEEKEQYDQLLAQVVRLSKKAFDFSDDRSLFVEGQSNILNDVTDIEPVKKLIRALEEKLGVLKVLDDTLNSQGVNTLIGRENRFDDLSGCSVVAATYSNGKFPLGSLGIIGPTRMDYSRVIPIIDYTAKALSHAIANQ